MTNRPRRFGWAAVVAVLIGVGLTVGLFFGMLGIAGLLPSAVVPILCGLVSGVAGALLVARMRPAR